MTWPIRHLTADDLDAFHSASLSPDANQHIAECVECRALLQQDIALVQALEALPVFVPRKGFADRILDRVTAPVPVPVPSRRRLALAASVLIGVGTSVVWSLINRPLLISWIDRVAGEIGRAAWVSLATVAQNLSEQPWASDISRFGSSTGRLILAGTVLAIGYAAAMISLRRLLVQPVQPVFNAD